MPLSGEYEPAPTDWVAEQVAQYEATDGREGGTFKGKPVVILTSLGAKSGKLRKNPVMRTENGGLYAVIASNAGSHNHPVWYHNLIAHPLVELQDGANKGDFTVRSCRDQRRTCGGDERWPATTNSIPTRRVWSERSRSCCCRRWVQSAVPLLTEP
jgi:F420H(2)-dependent quinone reductase